MAVGAPSSATSVPAWLAVVVPVLAALASGSAGVVGALLGGRTATRTAERNAALARQDEQRRSNRERRETAYITLLERRDRLVKVRCKWCDVGPDQPIREYGRVISGRDELLPAERALDEALTVVELIGSARAVESARALREHFCDWEWEVPMLSCSEDFKGEEELFGCPVGWRDQFVALIREELGVDE